MFAPILPFFLWFFIIMIILILWWRVALRREEKTTHQRRFTFRYERPEVGEFGEQMETDLRLTYKRFKELYPHSKTTYPEYKMLQKQKAFKRAVSSQKIKRMVR